MGPQKSVVRSGAQSGSRRPNLVEPHIDVKIRQARRRKVVKGVQERQRSDARRWRAQLDPEALQGWDAAESGEHCPVRCHCWRINTVVVQTPSCEVRGMRGPSWCTKSVVRGPCPSWRLSRRLLENRHLRMGPQRNSVGHSSGGLQIGQPTELWTKPDRSPCNPRRVAGPTSHGYRRKEMSRGIAKR